MEDFPPALSTVGKALYYVFVGYSSTVLLVPLVSVFQEYRIWASSSRLPNLSLYSLLRIYIFNVLWMGVTYVGALLLVPKWIIKGFGTSVQREAHCVVERYTAFLCVVAMVGPVEVRGAENLPPDDGRTPAPVYVANHCSQVDLGAVYYLFRRFKWISKKSVVYLPGVGQIMAMSGHVFINRKTGKNKKSVSNLYEQSNKAVQSGIPMFLFPQGTRRMHVRKPFKDGAFNIALANESSLVPVSVHIPVRVWNSWYPISLLWGGQVEPVVLTVHKPIEVTKDMDKEKLKKQCFDVIYSVLPPALEDENVGEDKKVA